MLPDTNQRSFEQIVTTIWIVFKGTAVYIYNGKQKVYILTVLLKSFFNSDLTSMPLILLTFVLYF